MSTTIKSVRRIVLLDILASSGIQTIGDLDTWRNTHIVSDRFGRHVPSRFSSLRFLIGEDAAISILNELAIRQCTGIGGVQ